jgi:hypothetical protein
MTAALSVAGAAFAAVAPAAEAAHSASTAVLDWNAEAGRAAVIACISPTTDAPHEARMYAMSSLAVHDALNAIDRRAEFFAEPFRAPAWASVDAAVAAAAHDSLIPGLRAVTGPFVPCLDAAVADVESFYAAQLAAIPDGPAKTAGLDAGHRAAAAVVARRAHDGSDTLLVDSDFPEGTTPGAYRFTPGSPFAFAPKWGDVTPFAIRSATQFQTAPPLPLTSARYARDLNEVKDYGGDGVTTSTKRNAWQTEVALFWWESSPLMWDSIARTLSVERHLDPWRQARLLAILNATLSDGYVAVLAEKYDYLFWRPVTAIRLADEDGNPATAADPSWTPLEITPAIPDHPSGHSIEGGAAAGVFQAFFGTDHVRFTACSTTVTAGDGTCDSAHPIVHRFSSFSQAAWENAESRILIGFHFRYATEVGTNEGLSMGHWTAAHFLPPAR